MSKNALTGTKLRTPSFGGASRGSAQAAEAAHAFDVHEGGDTGFSTTGVSGTGISQTSYVREISRPEGAAKAPRASSPPMSAAPKSKPPSAAPRSAPPPPPAGALRSAPPAKGSVPPRASAQPPALGSLPPPARIPREPTMELSLDDDDVHTAANIDVSGLGQGPQFPGEESTLPNASDLEDAASAFVDAVGSHGASDPFSSRPSTESVATQGGALDNDDSIALPQHRPLDRALAFARGIAAGGVELAQRGVALAGPLGAQLIGKARELAARVDTDGIAASLWRYTELALRHTAGALRQTADWLDRLRADDEETPREG